MDKEQKAAVVKELSTELEDADAVFAIDYRGISVPQAAELREELRGSETRFRVVKNRITLRAADAAGTTSLKEHLEGPTALAFVKGDAALAAKTIARLGSQWDLLTYKGGLMEGDVLDPESFQAIARLPGRDALNAQAAGIIASPLTGLIRGLGSMVQGLAIQLHQISEKGLVSGEAPPATEGAEEDQQPQGAETSEPDPEPTSSPEETSQEDLPEEAAEERAEVTDQTAEGDAEIGSAQEEATEDGEAGEERSDDSDEDEKEDR